MIHTVYVVSIDETMFYWKRLWYEVREWSYSSTERKKVEVISIDFILQLLKLRYMKVH